LEEPESTTLALLQVSEPEAVAVTLPGAVKIRDTVAVAVAVQPVGV
jgi:hypothetical protein